MYEHNLCSLLFDHDQISTLLYIHLLVSHVDGFNLLFFLTRNDADVQEHRRKLYKVSD